MCSRPTTVLRFECVHPTRRKCHREGTGAASAKPGPGAGAETLPRCLLCGAARLASQTWSVQTPGLWTGDLKRTSTFPQVTTIFHPSCRLVQAVASGAQRHSTCSVTVQLGRFTRQLCDSLGAPCDEWQTGSKFSRSSKVATVNAAPVRNVRDVARVARGHTRPCRHGCDVVDVTRVARGHARPCRRGHDAVDTTRVARGHARPHCRGHDVTRVARGHTRPHRRGCDVTDVARHVLAAVGGGWSLTCSGLGR